jgi:hypothetical protein
MLHYTDDPGERAMDIAEASCLEQYMGDDYERAKAHGWDKLPANDVVNGQKRGELMAGWKRHRDEVQAAIEWVKMQM